MRHAGVLAGRPSAGGRRLLGGTIVGADIGGINYDGTIEPKADGSGYNSARCRSDGRVELCHHWMSEQRAQEWLRDHAKEAYFADLVARVRQKMRAIGIQSYWRRLVSMPATRRSGSAGLG